MAIFTVAPANEAAAYVAGDVFGEGDGVAEDGIYVLAGMVENKRSALIHHVNIQDIDNKKPDLRLHFFKSRPADQADNAALSLTDANWKAKLCTINIASADWVTSDTKSSVDKDSLGKQVDFTTVSVFDIWLIIEITGGYTFTRTDALVLNIHTVPGEYT